MMLQSLADSIGRRRLPLILQTENAECGLACLAMVAGYHGHRVDLNTLRRRHPVSLKGVTLKALMLLASHLKLAAARCDSISTIWANCACPRSSTGT